MTSKKICLIICLLSTTLIFSENTKAPRPGVNPTTNNAISEELAINLVPVLNLLRRVLLIQESTNTDMSTVLPLIQQTLQIMTNQEYLMEQDYAQALVSSGLLQSIISLLEQQNYTENTESLVQLLTVVLSLVVQTQQTTSTVADEQKRLISQQEECCSLQLAQSSLVTAQLQDLISNPSTCSCSDETNSLLNVLLSIIITQQAEIDSLKNEITSNFSSIETNLQSLTAQAALQENQLQNLITTLADVQTDVIATLTTLQAHV